MLMVIVIVMVMVMVLVVMMMVMVLEMVTAMCKSTAASDIPVTHDGFYEARRSF